MPQDKVKQMKKRGTSLKDVLAMTGKEMSSLGLSARALSEIKAVPIFTAEKINISFKSNKASGKNTGTIKFDLKLVKCNLGRQTDKRGANECSFVVAVGTPQNGFLLSQKSVMMSARGQKDTTTSRPIELTFDWTLANSCGGANSGHVILRVLSTGVKGMDMEYLVPLT